MLKWKTKFTLISLNSKQTNLYSRVISPLSKMILGNLAVSLPYSEFCLRSPDNLLECDEIVPLANYSLCLLFTPGKNWDLGVDVYSKKTGSQNWLPPIQKHQCLQEKIQTTLCGKGGGFKNTSGAPYIPAFHLIPAMPGPRTLRSRYTTQRSPNLPLCFALALFSAWNVAIPVSFLTLSCAWHILPTHKQNQLVPSLCFLSWPLSSHLTH